MKKSMKKTLLLMGATLPAIGGLVGLNVFNQFGAQNVISKDSKTFLTTYNSSYKVGATQLKADTSLRNTYNEIMPIFTVTGRNEVTDEAIVKKIASILGKDFGKKGEDYIGLEDVDAPVRIFLAMQFSPKIEENKDNNKIDASFNSATLAQKVPKEAKYMAIFKITGSDVERVYDENSKTGNGIRELIDSDFDGDYISTDTKIQFTTDYELVGSDSYVAVFFTDEAGYIGYNLVIKQSTDDNRIVFSNPNICYYKQSEKGSQMYLDATTAYASGETYGISNVEPIDQKGEYVFLAWFDKEHNDYSARLLKSGTEIEHFFNRSAGSVQTLDAIWAHHIIAKDVSEYYNGKTHEQDADFGYSGDLDEEYLDQLDDLGIEENDTNTTWYDKDNNQLDGAPIDAGTYKENFSKAIVLKNGVNSQIEKNVEADANVTIKKRNVTISSESLVKVYDGTPLVNNGTDGVNTGTMMDENIMPDNDNGNGWVNGEGIDTNTVQFTGSQTNIGKSLNTFSYEVNEQTKLSNYNITEEFGTLEVKPRYQIEYYYDNVKADEETKLYEMRSNDVYYEIGDIVNLLDDEAPKTRQYNDIDYKLLNVDNEELTLTTVDENNIIKVYYGSKDFANPSTIDNISKYIRILLVSLTSIIGLIILKLRFIKKEER